MIGADPLLHHPRSESFLRALVKIFQMIWLLRWNVGQVFGGYPFDSCKAISEGFGA